MTAAIDFTKPLEAVRKFGIPVPFELITSRGRASKLPVVGYIGDDTSMTLFRADGTSVCGRFTLRNVRRRVEYWANAYPNDVMCLHRTPGEAARSATPDALRVAVHLVEADDNG